MNKERQRIWAFSLLAAQQVVEAGPLSYARQEQLMLRKRRRG
jgi:hypothetical protein